MYDTIIWKILFCLLTKKSPLAITSRLAGELSLLRYGGLAPLSTEKQTTNNEFPNYSMIVFDQSTTVTTYLPPYSLHGQNVPVPKAFTILYDMRCMISVCLMYSYSGIQLIERTPI